MFLSKKVPENLHNFRIDIILTELNLVESRNKALSIIMSGNVYVDDRKILKPGKFVKSNSIIKIIKKDISWVSRGGTKLDGALQSLNINPYNKVCMDVGCSTGGFTDVLLDRGVKKVYAIDVGYGQFDWRLRNSKRVILYERTNIKNINSEMFAETLDFIVCDVSFISLTKALIPVKKFLSQNYQILALIKPQFEVLRKDIGKGGIIRDILIHQKVCKNINKWFKENFKYTEIKIIESQILGQKGNKEFFIYLNY